MYLSSLTPMPGLQNRGCMGYPGMPWQTAGPFGGESAQVSGEAQEEALRSEIVQILLMLLGELAAQQQGCNTAPSGRPFGSLSPYMGGPSCTPAQNPPATPGANPTGGGDPQCASGPINNPTDFSVQLLKSLGAPVTSANVNSITNWQKREGGNWNNSAHYNPLNTTLGMPGATSMNSVGVKAYASWDEGLQATVKTLNNGHYNDILSALQSGNGLGNGTYQGLSTWSGGGYSSV